MSSKYFSHSRENHIPLTWTEKHPKGPAPHTSFEQLKGILSQFRLFNIFAQKELKIPHSFDEI